MLYFFARNEVVRLEIANCEFSGFKDGEELLAPGRGLSH